jgi:glycosyltransferase involved in cell wall biosynthesis
MWVKNGAWCLPPVLHRINQVIPPSQICCKIFIDDGSTDNTGAIGRKYGWKVIRTKGLGVGYAAQIALDHVDRNYFCSFEQDVLLNPQWFSVLYPQIRADPKIAVIQGDRLSTLKPMRILEQWTWRRKPFHVSIDNNIYRTDVIRKIGGFPKRRFAGVDTNLHNILVEAGWRWKLERSIVSLHIRKSLASDVKRLYRYHMSSGGEIWRSDPKPITSFAFRFLFSPLRGLIIAFEMKYPLIAFIYPVIRFFSYKGYVDSAKLDR